VLPTTHGIVNGGLVTGPPRGWPSSRNCTEVTVAGGAADADACRVTVPVAVDPSAGLVSVALGGVIVGFD
jgi:hypothetical protein